MNYFTLALLLLYSSAHATQSSLPKTYQDFKCATLMKFGSLSHHKIPPSDLPLPINKFIQQIYAKIGEAKKIEIIADDTIKNFGLYVAPHNEIEGYDPSPHHRVFINFSKVNSYVEMGETLRHELRHVFFEEKFKCFLSNEVVRPNFDIAKVIRDSGLNKETLQTMKELSEGYADLPFSEFYTHSHAAYDGLSLLSVPNRSEALVYRDIVNSSYYTLDVFRIKIFAMFKPLTEQLVLNLNAPGAMTIDSWNSNGTKKLASIDLFYAGTTNALLENAKFKSLSGEMQERVVALMLSTYYEKLIKSLEVVTGRLLSYTTNHKDFWKEFSAETRGMSEEQKLKVWNTKIQSMQKEAFEVAAPIRDFFSKVEQEVEKIIDASLTVILK